MLRVYGISEGVDSDIFDSGTFQQEMQKFETESGQHMVSSPFELSQYPIEVREHREALHRQLTNRYFIIKLIASLFIVARCLSIIQLDHIFLF